jgi:hypothetical protein
VQSPPAAPRTQRGETASSLDLELYVAAEEEEEEAEVGIQDDANAKQEAGQASRLALQYLAQCRLLPLLVLDLEA